MDLDLAFKAANLLASAIMVLGGLTQVLGFGQIKYLIVGAYVLTFGLANASLEFMPAHDLITRYLPFLFSFIGRGLFYIFVGSLIIGESALSILAAVPVILIGIAYVALEFMPQFERPSNMRDVSDFDDEVEGVV